MVVVTAFVAGTIATGVVVGGLFGVTVVGVTAFAIGLATTVALGAASRALMPKPSFSQSNRGYQTTAIGTALDHQIIYGKMRVGGARIYDESTGENTQFLHRIIAVAGHEIESFDSIYIDDEIVTLDGIGNVISPARYFDKVYIRTHLGSTDQLADATLVRDSSHWTNQHRLRGIAYIYITFSFDADVFPNGIPEITSVVSGKKVYDPRSGVTAWSDNPALCLRDYLVSGYGLSEEPANIDDTLVIAAANVADQTNTIAGTTRYTCNGAFTTAATPYDMIGSLLTSMDGSMWYAQGKWRMKPAYWTAPVLALTEDDLRSSINVSTRHSRRDNFNVVKGTFRGSESNWQTTDYPQVTNPAFLAADNGQESVADVDLPFTDNSIEARRIALIALERNRQQLTVSASFGLRTLEVQVGDNVTLTSARFGWDSKEFEVVSWNFGLVGDYDLQTNMVLRETAESVYDEVNDGVVYERDNTTLPSAFDVPSVGLSISSDLRLFNERVTSVVSATVTSSSPEGVDYVEVQYAKELYDDFTVVGTGQLGVFEILDLIDGEYYFRARAVNYFGVKGEFVSVDNFFVEPFANPPETVQNFTGNSVGSLLHLTWTAVNDLDLSHYKIRYSPDLTGASYQDSTDIVLSVARPAVSITVPARSGTYFIKAIDKSGIASLQPSSFVLVTNVIQVESLNVVELITESPNYLGVKDGTLVTDNADEPYLTLDTSNEFDDTEGDFDEELGLFDGGGDSGSILNSGTYYFSNETDLGSVFTSRVSTNIESLFLDYVNTFDSATGNFDSRLGDFDGDPSQFDLTSVGVQVAYTNDDPSGNPTWSPYQSLVVSDITARAMKFRAILTSQSAKAAPAVTALSVTIDMPDRLSSGSDIVYTGSKSVTFDTPFKETPSLGLSVTLVDGDRYEVSSKSRVGFTLTTYTGASVSTNNTTFDYVAKGYGREAL